MPDVFPAKKTNPARLVRPAMFPMAKAAANRDARSRTRQPVYRERRTARHVLRSADVLNVRLAKRAIR